MAQPGARTNAGFGATARPQAVSADRRPVPRRSGPVVPNRSVVSTDLASLSRFGIVAAKPGRLTVGPRDISARTEAFRSRIRDFVDGSYRPNGLGAFLKYLAERTLGLETRRDMSGRDTNYLVDLRSSQSVPAASVDSRLSVDGIKRVFGMTPTEVADKIASDMTPEAKRARSIQRTAAPVLYARPETAPFTDWSDMRLCSKRLFGGDMTARGRELWVGKEIGVASEDPRQNLALLARLAARGHENVIAPARTKADLAAGRLVPGMVIMDRSTATRLSLVSPSLGFDRLSQTFGQDLFDHYEELGARFKSERRVTTDDAEYRRLFVVNPRRAPAPVETKTDFVVRQSIMDGQEVLEVVWRDRSVESLDFTKVQPGRYRKEDQYGMPAGLIDINAKGYSHIDTLGRAHNESGPAVFIMDGPRRVETFALAGEQVEEERLYEPAPVVKPAAPALRVVSDRTQPTPSSRQDQRPLGGPTRSVGR